MNDDAVSPVIGYLLVFMVVIIAVALIYSQSYPLIRKQQYDALFKGVENTFLIMDEIQELVAYDVVTSKSITVRIDDGWITLKEVGYINASGDNFSYSVIEYEIENNNLILELGAVIKCYHGKCIMISEPRIFNTGDGVFLSLIDLSGELSFSGLKEIQFSHINSSIQNVNIEIKPYSKTVEVWKSFLNGSDLSFTWDEDNESFKKDNVILAIHGVEVS